MLKNLINELMAYQLIQESFNWLPRLTKFRIFFYKTQ